MIATECVASNRCHICRVSFEFKRQLRWQVNPFILRQGLATDLTWTSCVYRSILGCLILDEISRHETFVGLSGLRATDNTYCKMSTRQMPSDWRLPKRETNNLGFLELFGFSVGLPDWWIIKRRTPRESGWEMFCHCGWQRLCVKKNENRFEVFPRNPKFADVKLKLRIDTLHVDGSKFPFRRRLRGLADAMNTTFFSRESTPKSFERKWNKRNSLFWHSGGSPSL